MIYLGDTMDLEFIQESILECSICNRGQLENFKMSLKKLL